MQHQSSPRRNARVATASVLSPRRLVAPWLIAVAALAFGTSATASAGVPLKTSHRPALSPAALAAALQRHPFSTANLGYGVSFDWAQAPRHTGDVWQLTGVAPALSPEVKFQFMVFGTAGAADEFWAQVVSDSEYFHENLFAISPYPSWCARGAWGYFACRWTDRNVSVDCYGGPNLHGSALCSPLITASLADLRAVDRGAGF